jgi:hypothetical protein
MQHLAHQADSHAHSRRVEQRLREARGVELGRGGGRAERGGDDAVAVEPAGRRHPVTARDAPALARRQHERVDAPVAVVGPQRFGQLGVQREAGPGQRPQR